MAQVSIYCDKSGIIVFEDPTRSHPGPGQYNLLNQKAISVF